MGDVEATDGGANSIDSSGGRCSGDSTVLASINCSKTFLGVDGGFGTAASRWCDDKSMAATVTKLFGAENVFTLAACLASAAG